MATWTTLEHFRRVATEVDACGRLQPCWSPPRCRRMLQQHADPDPSSPWRSCLAWLAVVVDCGSGESAAHGRCHTPPSADSGQHPELSRQQLHAHRTRRTWTAEQRVQSCGLQAGWGVRTNGAVWEQVGRCAKNPHGSFHHPTCHGARSRKGHVARGGVCVHARQKCGFASSDHHHTESGRRGRTPS